MLTSSGSARSAGNEGFFECAVAQTKTIEERMLVVSTKGSINMNWDIVEGNWKQFQGRIQARWASLTNDQLDVISGKRTELAGKIQESYGVSKEEVEEQIKLFEKQNEDFKPTVLK
jgi:uncharacterized protein YjbJ (UPF0337 family)